MKIHDLAPPPGSKKARRRVGRGIAGKGGKTAGRGMKGPAPAAASRLVSRVVRPRSTAVRRS